MPIISGTLLKAQELSISIETRAFRAFPERTSFIEIKLGFYDYFVMILSGLFVVVMMIFNY